MAKLTSLFKDTAIYGVSSIVGRFLNYLLVPLYTMKLPADGGGYGVVTNVYSYVALLMVILTYGMESGFFYFSSIHQDNSQKVYTTSLSSLMCTCLLFLLGVLLFIHPVSSFLGYQQHPEYLGLMALVVSMDAFLAIPFAHLRYLKRPIVFAARKMLFIFCSIGFNLFFLLACPWLMKHAPHTIDWFYDPSYLVGYIFIANLLATAMQFLCFLPELIRLKWTFDKVLLTRMLRYAGPILILGVVSILNRSLDKILFPYLYGGDHKEAMHELGIYGASVKVAMIMSMLLQSFRYAYEPFVFGQKNTTGEAAKKSYSDAMKYFCMFSLLTFLLVMCFIDILKYFIAEDYWAGLQVVPVVMAAELLVGIYFNLSFWYKLKEQTKWGAYFALAGFLVILLGNILFVPYFSYMASAWASVAGYLLITLLSYFIGQHYYPVDYQIKRIGGYLLVAVAILLLYEFVPMDSWSIWVKYPVRVLLLGSYIWYMDRHDFPLRPLVNRLLLKK